MTPDVPESQGTENPPFRKGPRFWAILAALSLISLLTSLEATVTSTVMPTVVADLGGGDDYIWVSNAYFLTMTSLMPLYGQLANAFGRRWPLIGSGVVFMIGSGVCGSATSMAAMVAGRAVQGVGGAGIGVLCEVVVGDLVPLRQRGTYMGAVFGMVGLGAALGPLFGGLLVSGGVWRWAFYLALPIGGAAVALLVVVLRVRHGQPSPSSLSSSFRTLARLDWLGNALVAGGTAPVLVALGWAGGRQHPWSSPAVLVPLLVGLAALAALVVLEGGYSGLTAPPANPLLPRRLFANAVGAVVLLLAFLHGLLTMWVLYFLPVYFQGVLGFGARRAGAALLPTVLALLPGAAAGGLLLSRFGRYKPVLVLGFALVVAGLGLLARLDAASPAAYWAGVQVLESAGAGLAMAVLLPALLAPLSDRDTALATAAWGFLRSFGVLWGVAVAGSVYTTRAAQLAAAGAISGDPGDPADAVAAAVASQFAAGGAYAAANAAFLDALPAPTRAQVVAVQTAALRRAWLVALAFGAAGLVASVAIPEVPLRTENDTEFGMVEKDERVEGAVVVPAAGGHT